MNAMRKYLPGIMCMMCLLWIAAGCASGEARDPLQSPDAEIAEETLFEAEDDGDGDTAPDCGDTLDEPVIVVLKSERRLELYDDDVLVVAYPIALGWEPIGDKKKEGDGRTPEGDYYVCTRNEQSRYYLSLGVSYPNKGDAEEALRAGLIDNEAYDRIANAIDNLSKPPWDTPLGGEIMIHGMGSQKDWTAGCVAVDNDVMDVLWKYCPLGTPVVIKP